MTIMYLIVSLSVIALIVAYVWYRTATSSPHVDAVKGPPPGVENVSPVLAIASNLKDRYVLPKLDWYQRKKVLPMVLYRTSGILTICLSVAIPVVSQSTWFEPYNKNVLAGC